MFSYCFKHGKKDGMNVRLFLNPRLKNLFHDHQFTR
jgi:hypothetical protein